VTVGTTDGDRGRGGAASRQMRPDITERLSGFRGLALLEPHLGNAEYEDNGNGRPEDCANTKGASKHQYMPFVQQYAKMGTTNLRLNQFSGMSAYRSAL